MRLFIALWPSVKARQTLEQWSERHLSAVGGRRIPAEQMHITLQFLDEIEKSHLARLKNTIATACREISAFSVTMNTIDIWRKAGLGVLLGDWVTKKAITSRRLHCLVDTTTCGPYSISEQTGNSVPRFKPHITLARKLPTDIALPKDTPTIHWEATEITLVHSVLTPKGPTYRILERFALTGTSLSIEKSTLIE